MILKPTVALFLGLLLFCCTQKQQEESKTVKDSLQVEPDTLSNLSVKGIQLQEYEKFLNSLDVSDVTMVTEASDRFLGMFYDQDKATCDSAYYLFDNFYSNVNSAINTHHYNDTTNYDSLVMIFGPEVRLSQKLLDYREQLAKNGFMISMTEGVTYIQQDRDFMKRFYKHLSPVMVMFLEQRNKEIAQGTYDDGGLVIGPEELVDRIIWWERFNKENPQFVFNKLPHELQTIYTTSLVIGEDNTPLLSYEDKLLDRYYKIAYDHLLNKYADSKTAKSLNPYYSALVKNDTAAIQEFKDAYLKELN